MLEIIRISSPLIYSKKEKKKIIFETSTICLVFVHYESMDLGIQLQKSSPIKLYKKRVCSASNMGDSREHSKLSSRFTKTLLIQWNGNTVQS